MLVFIGTLHCNLTPHDELIKLIKSFKPQRLLVEVSQKDLEDNNTNKYPDEMQAVLAWGINNHIDIRGFDCDISTLKDDASEENLKKLDEEQTAITSKHDWKDFNQAHLDKILQTKSWYKVINKTKNNERELELYKNIIRSTGDSGITVIVTGSDHIPFFRNKFPAAQFPLRTSAGS